MHIDEIFLCVLTWNDLKENLLVKKQDTKWICNIPSFVRLLKEKQFQYAWNISVMTHKNNITSVTFEEENSVARDKEGRENLSWGSFCRF